MKTVIMIMMVRTMTKTMMTMIIVPQAFLAAEYGEISMFNYVILVIKTMIMLTMTRTMIVSMMMLKRTTVDALSYDNCCVC